MRYKKSYARKKINAMIDEVESIREHLIKDFGDMDLENASVRHEIEEYVNAAVRGCDALAEELRRHRM